jgi:hypothetical protein
MKSSSQAAAWLACAAAALLAVSACGDDSAPDEGTASAAGKAGAPAAGATNGGNSAKAGSTPNGGTNSGNTAGTPSSAGAGAGIGEPPGPAPGGGSVYAVECSGETAMCGVERSHCLGISVGDGKTGYSCSNRCDTVDDCSDEPSGAEASVGCVQFKQEKRCVLVCYNQPNEYACPDGMSCYIYPNSPSGYCLWMK